MLSRETASLLWIDLAGGSLLAGLLFAFVWLAFLGDDPAKRENHALNQAIDSSHRQSTSLRAALAKQRKLLEARRKELQETGRLPEQPPIEKDLQMLAVLAKANRLDVLRVTPLPPKEYPGLLELRYSFEATGTMPDLAQFFKAVEEASCWADVSFLKMEIDRNARDIDSSANRLLAVLTISLFSSSSSSDDAHSG